MQIKNKTILKRCCCVILTLGILFGALKGLSFLVTPRDDTTKAGMYYPDGRGFYSYPQNSIDVFVIGNSDSYCGFSPMELWHNYGFTSYNSGEPEQRATQGLNMLKEILTRHKPKVVLLDLDEIFEGKNTIGNAFSDIFSYEFPIFNYHNRWKTLDLSSAFQETNYTNQKSSIKIGGQHLNSKIKAYTGQNNMKKNSSFVSIPWASKYAMDQMQKLCQENGAAFVLIDVPAAITWTGARHDAAKAYAESKGIPFLDLNTDLDSMGFSWETDTMDAGYHINVVGAAKVTNYLGEYLKQNYSLADHRSDSDYSFWNDNYQIYEQAVQKSSS